MKERTDTEVWVEFGDYPLVNGKGEAYHVLRGERCRVAMVSRRRIGMGPDGKDVELPAERELAFVRNGGAWLPPVFP